MTDLNDDLLRRAWQSGTPVDMDKVARRLTSVNRQHRLFNQLAFSAGWMLTALLAATEAAGALPTQGWLTALSASLLLLAYVLHVLARRNLKRRYSDDPAALMDFTIGRLRAGLWLGRTLYLVLPVAVLLGYLAGGLIAASLLGGAPDAPSPILAALMTTFMLMLIISGLRIARRRMRDLSALKVAQKDIAGCM